MKPITTALIKYGIVAFIVGLMALFLGLAFIAALNLISPAVNRPVWVSILLGMATTAMAILAFARATRGLSTMAMIGRQTRVRTRMETTREPLEDFLAPPARPQRPWLAPKPSLGILDELGGDPIQVQPAVRAAYDKLSGIPKT